MQMGKQHLQEMAGTVKFDERQFVERELSSHGSPAGTSNFSVAVLMGFYMSLALDADIVMESNPQEQPGCLLQKSAYDGEASNGAASSGDSWGSGVC